MSRLGSDRNPFVGRWLRMLRTPEFSHVYEPFEVSCPSAAFYLRVEQNPQNKWKRTNSRLVERRLTKFRSKERRKFPPVQSTSHSDGAHFRYSCLTFFYRIQPPNSTMYNEVEAHLEGELGTTPVTTLVVVTA